MRKIILFMCFALILAGCKSGNSSNVGGSSAIQTGQMVSGQTDLYMGNRSISNLNNVGTTTSKRFTLPTGVMPIPQLTGNNIIDMYSCGDYIYYIEEMPATSSVPLYHKLWYGKASASTTVSNTEVTLFQPINFFPKSQGTQYVWNYVQNNYVRYDGLTCIDGVNGKPSLLAMSVRYHNYSTNVPRAVEELVLFNPVQNKVRRATVQAINDASRTKWRSTVLRDQVIDQKADIRDILHETIYPINPKGKEKDIYNLVAFGATDVKEFVFYTDEKTNQLKHRYLKSPMPTKLNGNALSAFSKASILDPGGDYAYVVRSSKEYRNLPIIQILNTGINIGSIDEDIADLEMPGGTYLEKDQRLVFGKILNKNFLFLLDKNDQVDGLFEFKINQKRGASEPDLSLDAVTQQYDLSTLKEPGSSSQVELAGGNFGLSFKLKRPIFTTTTASAPLYYYRDDGVVARISVNGSSFSTAFASTTYYPNQQARYLTGVNTYVTNHQKVLKNIKDARQNNPSSAPFASAKINGTNYLYMAIKPDNGSQKLIVKMPASKLSTWAYNNK